MREEAVTKALHFIKNNPFLSGANVKVYITPGVRPLSSETQGLLHCYRVMGLPEGLYTSTECKSLSLRMSAKSFLAVATGSTGIVVIQ